MTLAEFEKQIILATMHEHGGNRQRVAAALDIGLRTLSGKLREYGVPPRGKGWPASLPDCLKAAGVKLDVVSLRQVLVDVLVAANDAHGTAIAVLAAEDPSQGLLDTMKRRADFLLQKLGPVFEALSPCQPPPAESVACGPSSPS